jgi:hypothetical protein
MHERVVERGWVCWAGLGEVWLGWKRGHLKSQPLLSSGGLPIGGLKPAGISRGKQAATPPLPCPASPWRLQCDVLLFIGMQGTQHS